MREVTSSTPKRTFFRVEVKEQSRTGWLIVHETGNRENAEKWAEQWQKDPGARAVRILKLDEERRWE